MTVDIDAQDFSMLINPYPRNAITSIKKCHANSPWWCWAWRRCSRRTGRNSSRRGSPRCCRGPGRSSRACSARRTRPRRGPCRGSRPRSRGRAGCRGRRRDRARSPGTAGSPRRTGRTCGPSSRAGTRTRPPPAQSTTLGYPGSTGTSSGFFNGSRLIWRWLARRVSDMWLTNLTETLGTIFRVSKYNNETNRP